MRVMRVDEYGEATYELRGMTAEQAEMLGALAGFPAWKHQPERVAEFCAALHSSVERALPEWEDAALRADAHDMTPHTTVDLN